MDRRIFGIENEYGITCLSDGERRISPDEVSRYLFRKVVSWGRSSNVFLRNGARLYLDVGSHPEYATAECDDIGELIAQDKAGERILEELMFEAQERLHADGVDGDIYLFKNNTDSVGNSYGCHENFLITRDLDFQRIVDVLIPFLVTRQLLVGAGKVLPGVRGSSYCISQRAEHIWEGISSATTRSRPIINTRDEPHADADQFRRLHVIVGDSNMSEVSALLKIASADLVLRMIERGVVMRDLTLENPIKAIRDISADITGRQLLKLANGREVTALEMQGEYLSKVKDFLVRDSITDPRTLFAVDLWERTLDAIATQNFSAIDREIEWVIKLNLISRYMDKHGLDWGSPRIAQIDLAYHDILRTRGLYYLLENSNLVDRICTEESIQVAKEFPPQTTRAKLRGDFIAAAQSKGRDFTVDWVHLKLNDQAQRTVLCKDPFRSVDDRVERLINSM
jgi:proteasome accessory factor A